MKFFIWSSTEPALLLKDDKGHFIFVKGKWSPTEVIKDYMYGHNDFVDAISEVEARTKFPEAFSS